MNSVATQSKPRLRISVLDLLYKDWFIKDVLYSILGPDLVGLTVAVCISAVCRGLNHTTPIVAQ